MALNEPIDLALAEMVAEDHVTRAEVRANQIVISLAVSGSISAILRSVRPRLEAIIKKHRLAYTLAFQKDPDGITVKPQSLLNEMHDAFVGLEDAPPPPPKNPPKTAPNPAA